MWLFVDGSVVHFVEPLAAEGTLFIIDKPDFQEIRLGFGLAGWGFSLFLQAVLDMVCENLDEIQAERGVPRGVSVLWNGK